MIKSFRDKHTQGVFEGGDGQASYSVTVAQLAAGLDVPISTISAIVDGARNIDGPRSKLLGHAFNMSEVFFANLQVRYELDRASLEAQNDVHFSERIRRADDFARGLRAS